MAAASPPVLVGAGLAAFEITSAPSFAPQLPAGIAQHDVLVLLLTMGTSGAFVAPAGWAQLAATNNGTSQRTEVYWKRATASETPPVVSLASNDATAVMGGRIYAIRGCPTDRHPFGQALLQANTTPSATIALPACSTASSQELVLALAAYADDPLVATTMAGWTQPALAVQGYSWDPWSGSYVVESADPDIPSGGMASPGAAVLHQHRTLGTAGSAGTSSITVSGGSFSPAVSTTLVLAVIPAPTGSPQVSIRARVLSTRGGPARGRARVGAQSVSRKLTEQTSSLVARFKARIATLRTSLTELVSSARVHGRAEVRKTSVAQATAQVSTSAIVDSQRSPYFANGARPQLSIRAQTTYRSVLSPGPLPVRPSRPVDLGEIYRGDTVRLPTWVAQARNGQPIDLTGCVLRFTAKLDLGDPDTDPLTINASSEDGTVWVLDPPTAGQYRVMIQSVETEALDIDAVFAFDVQLETALPYRSVHTIQHGTLLVNRDVTRSSS